MTAPFDQCFDEIASGWMLVDDVEELGEIIERLGDLVLRAGGLAACSELQRSTIKMMIETQVAKGIVRGDFLDCGIGPEDLEAFAEALSGRGRPII